MGVQQQLAAGLLLGLLISEVYAAGPTPPKEFLHEEDLFGNIPSVSVATRLEQTVAKTPASVTIIDRDLIRNIGAQNLVDVFRLVPGFQSYMVNGNRFGVSAHGIGKEFPSHLEVMIDGRSVYEPLLSTVSWGSLGLNIEDIDHIEIVRGSSAPTHGSNAFLGAVNIITRQPVQDSGTAVRTTVGSRDTQNISLRHNDRFGKLHYRLSLGYLHNDGFPGFYAPGENSGPLEDGAETYQFNFLGSYTPSLSDTLDISLGYAHDRMGFGDADHPDEFMPTRFEAHYQSLKWVRLLNDGDQLQIHGYHNALKGSGRGELGLGSDFFGVSPQIFEFVLGVPDHQLFSALDLASERYDLELQHQVNLTKTLRGVWGLGGRSEYAESVALLNRSDRIWEQAFRAFGHVEWQPVEPLSFNVGVMVEKTFIDTLVSPRLAANYQLNSDQTLRASFGTGRRAPSILEAQEYQVFQIAGKIIDPSRQVASDLKEERLTSYELGYSGNFLADRLSVDVRFYREEIRDGMLDVRAPWAPEPPLTSPPLTDTILERDNVGDWTTSGAELQLQYRPGARSLIRLHYANQDLDSRVVDRYLPVLEIDNIDNRQARHSGGLALTHRFNEAWDAGLFTYYQSDVKWHNGNGIEEFTRVDAQASYTFAVGRTNGNVQFIVQNLGGDYAEYNHENIFETRGYIKFELLIP